MTANFDTGDRDVVPRWRSVRRTIETGEFQTCPPRNLDRNHEAQLRAFEEAWRRSPGRLTALELVEASLVANGPERARSAADWLLKRDGLVGVMARRATTGDVPHPLPDTHGELPHRAYRRIARTKQKLLANPRSAILWGDLARRYTSLGQFDQAKHALRVARILAPNSRYLLRSQVRFLVHVDRADEAVSVLQQHPRTLGDPWLMAALLSVSEQADRPLPGKKHIRRLLDDDGFRPIERSELASESGTLELRSGATRMGRRLLSAALTNPTDNSLAQVEWVSNRFEVLKVDLEQFAVPFPDEARTRSAVQAGEWEAALSYAEAWMDDQPFDAGAAVLGSYVASVGLEDWERAILTARAGLLASPNDVTLRNNLAFALLGSNKLAEAATELAQIPSTSSDGSAQAAVLATRGLLAFRSGDPFRGSELYRSAITRARRASERDAEAMALSMLITETARAGDDANLQGLLEELSRVSGSVRESGVKLAIRRAERLAEIRLGSNE